MSFSTKRLQLLLRPLFVTLLYFFAIYIIVILFTTLVSLFQFSCFFTSIQLTFFPIIFNINSIVVHSAFLPLILTIAIALAFLHLEKSRYSFFLILQPLRHQLFSFFALSVFIFAITLISAKHTSEINNRININIQNSSALIKNQNFQFLKSGSKIKLNKSTVFYITDVANNKGYILIDTKDKPFHQTLQAISFKLNNSDKPTVYNEVTYKFKTHFLVIKNATITKRKLYSLKTILKNKSIIENLLRQYYESIGLPIFNYGNRSKYFLKAQEKQQKVRQWMHWLMPILFAILILVTIRVRKTSQQTDIFLEKLLYFLWPLLFVATYLFLLGKNVPNIKTRPDFHAAAYLVITFCTSTILICFTARILTITSKIREIISNNKRKKNTNNKEPQENNLLTVNLLKSKKTILLRFFQLGLGHLLLILLGFFTLLFIIFVFGRMFFVLNNNLFSIPPQVYLRHFLQGTQYFLSNVPLLLVLLLPFIILSIKKKGILNEFLPKRYFNSFISVSTILILIFITTILGLRNATIKMTRKIKHNNVQNAISFQPNKNYFNFDGKIIYFNRKIIFKDDRLNLDEVTAIDTKLNLLYKGRYATFSKGKMRIVNGVFIKEKNIMSYGTVTLPFEKTKTNFIRSYESLSSGLSFIENLKLWFASTNDNAKTFFRNIFWNNNKLFIFAYFFTPFYFLVIVRRFRF